MTGNMHAALFYDIGDVRYEVTNVPEIGDGEILIKVGTALTCGTDVKTYRKGHRSLLVGHSWTLLSCPSKNGTGIFLVIVSSIELFKLPHFSSGIVK